MSRIKRKIECTTEYERLSYELQDLIQDANINYHNELKTLSVEQLQEAKIKLLFLIADVKEEL